MSKRKWKDTKETIGKHSFLLGPYFASQAIQNPSHLLFTLSRYKFAERLFPQNHRVNVLELGCGEGFGTLVLAENGHKITAVDFDEKAITHATSTIDIKNIEFKCEDFIGQKFGEFQVVISLDVIEHIGKDKEDKFLKTACSNLLHDGFCLIGTPNELAEQYASKPSRVGHINLFTAKRLKKVMLKYFRNVFVFGMNDEVMHTGYYPMCHYLIGLGCGPRRIK